MKTIMILGGNGYIGWSIALDLATKTDYTILVVDNYNKLRWMDMVPSQSIFKRTMRERIDEFSQKTGKHNIHRFSIDVCNYESLFNLIDRYKPEVVINCAHQPSASFSLMNQKTANITLTNNEQSCLNTLWSVAHSDYECLIIMVGSMGIYSLIDSPFIPEEKVDLYFGNNKIKKTWLPTLAADFYHQTKANNFSLTELACRMGNLKVVTVQQSTVVGLEISDIVNEFELYPQLNYDSYFGTVLNRFVVKSVTKQHMTVYGDGKNQTGISTLKDCCNVFYQIIENMEIIPGEHKVINSLTERYTINELADIICNMTGNSMIHVPSPRPRFNVEYKAKVVESSIKTITNFENYIDNFIKTMYNLKGLLK
jgi:UDP-sulfoquinovose synthase